MCIKGKLRLGEGGYLVYCPGCEKHHFIDQRWRFDGNFDEPTFSPSILVAPNDLRRRCHSYIFKGKWQFLRDSCHRLAGQTVPIEDVD